MIAQSADEAEDFGDLAHTDCSGRLVHQHDLGFGESRSGNRNGLSLAAGHSADQIPRSRFRFQLREQFAGALKHRAIVEDTKGTETDDEFTAEIDIGGGSEVVAERQILVDDFDALCACVGWLVKGHLVAQHRIVPPLGGKLPAMILTRVDFHPRRCRP